MIVTRSIRNYENEKSNLLPRINEIEKRKQPKMVER